MSVGDFEIDVVYALPERQKSVRLRVAIGTTAREAALRSGLDAEFRGLDLRMNPLGIFGRLVPDAAVLHPGDRVELYRSLPADPRIARRERVEQERRLQRKT